MTYLEDATTAAVVEHEFVLGLVPRDWIEGRGDAAFTFAGPAIVGSSVVPPLLSVVVDRTWIVGLALIGLGVLATVLGVLALFPRLRRAAPRVSVAGALSATVGGFAALTLLALVAVAVVSIYGLEIDPPPPTAFFRSVMVVMSAGFGFGTLLSGVAIARTGVPSRSVGRLLTVAGLSVLIPGSIVVVTTILEGSSPSWVLFLGIALAALTVYLAGRRLRTVNAVADDDSTAGDHD